MSSDNYYTIKFDPVGLKWYVLQGFMSNLEYGIPTLLREGQGGYDTWEEAAEDAERHYSEYGLVQEEDGLSGVLTEGQWRECIEEGILRLQEHLFFLEGKDENAV